MSRSSANLLSLKSVKTSSFVLCLATVVLFGTGCASTGTIQPHHAFRQSATPYQAYQGYQQNFQPAGQANATTGFFGGNSSGGSSLRPFTAPSPVTGGYPQYAPPAAYSYQPAYNGGFSGTC